MAFLAAQPHPRPTVALLGIPYDATSTFRAGSRFGPDAIRWASQSIETYSPVLRATLDDIALSDLGNLDLAIGTPDALGPAVAGRVQMIAGASIPVLLGGEHTVTLGAVTAVAATHPELAVIQLDAHTDLRDAYDGRTVSHATVMRRIADQLGGERIVQLGVRAGTAEEFTYAAQALHHHSRGLDISVALWQWLTARPIYVTIDIDVLDPAEAPGTGNPEPEGVSGRELLAFVRRLSSLNVVGLDLVEVSPPYDASGRTAVMAATIVREAILAISRGRGSGVRSPEIDD